MGACSISRRGRVNKARYWKPKCPGHVPAYATSIFSLFRSTLEKID